MSLPVENRRVSNYRRNSLWTAAMIHRVSGLLLACFLPVHFLALGLAIEGEAVLDAALKWTDSTPLKFVEMVLIFLFAVHLLGGIRLMLIENLPWKPHQKQMAMTAIAAAALIAVLFVVRIL